MKVLILGFTNLKELDKTMEKLIEESQCFLFSIVCGGADNIAADWAKMKGAPLVYLQPRSPHDLVKEADYIVIKIDDNTPQWQKNLLMEFKQNGKHGTVVR